VTPVSDFHRRPPKQNGTSGSLPARVRPFFTPRTLAQYLSISERTVREMVRTGQLASYRVAGSRRIAAEDVDAYLAAHRSEEHV